MTTGKFRWFEGTADEVVQMLNKWREDYNVSVIELVHEPNGTVVYVELFKK